MKPSARPTPPRASKIVSLETARATANPHHVAFRRSYRPPNSPAFACWTTSHSRHCANSSTGRRSSIPGGLRASTRASSNTPKHGEQARQIFDEGNVLLDRIIEKTDHRPRRLWLLSRQCSRRRRRTLHRQHARKSSRPLPLPPPAGKQRRQRAVPIARRLYRAEGNRPARSHRCLRRDQWNPFERALRQVQGRQRRLQRNHGRGAC